MRKSVVAVVRCESYRTEEVASALERGLRLLGGVERFIRFGEKVLLKPNIVSGHEPERAVTTHPAVMQAMIRIMHRTGAQVAFGDSPGTEKPRKAAKKSGLLDAAGELGVELSDFETSSSIDSPEGFTQKKLPMAKAVLETEALISLPKMKTHQLTRITGSVKNQYGCIAGLHKGALHLKYPEVSDFSRMLAELNLVIRPRLTVMDGILAMEGNGPTAGEPRRMNVLIMSDDPVAVDATFCRIIDLDPVIVPTNTAGFEKGLGTFRDRDIEYRGDSFSSFVRRDFKVIRYQVSGHDLIKHFPVLKNMLLPRPVIDHALCRRCGFCIKACPVPGKAVRFNGRGSVEPPRYDYGACIRCYCCQEMCPCGAISTETPLLGRLFVRGCGGISRKLPAPDEVGITAGE
jgi:uncharacterized protein (DUF362 family)/Pyruvate/2-oxoacid:ferredoxin oxidoreductase delta subunit